MRGAARQPADDARGSRPRRFLRNRDGNFIVQFALLAPAFILVILGTIDMGRLAWTISSLEHSARNGARYAAVRGAGMPDEKTVAEITTYTQDSFIGIDSDSVTASVTYDPAGDNSEGSLVTVTVTQNITLMSSGLIGWDPLGYSRSSTLIVSGL